MRTGLQWQAAGSKAVAKRAGGRCYLLQAELCDFPARSSLAAVCVDAHDSLTESAVVGVTCYNIYNCSGTSCTIWHGQQCTCSRMQQAHRVAAQQLSPASAACEVAAVLCGMIHHCTIEFAYCDPTTLRAVACAYTLGS